MTNNTFNSDFYMTAATVIPIMFIALLLPNGPLARYGIWAKRRLWKHVIPPNGQPEPQTMKQRLVLILRLFLSAVVSIAIVIFIMGEISAIIALDQRHATLWEHQIVIYSLWSLSITTGLSVETSIAVTAFGELKEE